MKIKSLIFCLIFGMLLGFAAGCITVKYNFENTEDISKWSSIAHLDVKLLTTDFIKLDSELVSIKKLGNLERLETILTPSCFKEDYELSGRLINMPETSDLTFVGIDYIAIEQPIDSEFFSVMAVSREHNSKREYTSTYYVKVNKDMKVSSFIKIPHLR